MAEESIMFFENDDKSYAVVDLCINSNKYLEYIDSDNYYDIDVDKILFKKGDNEYIIRYNDVNKIMIVPLQLKIKNFRKCMEIWDKIIELIGINNHIYFHKADDDDELFIMADVHENTNFALEDNYRCDIIKL